MPESVTIDDVRAAEPVVRGHVPVSPLIRSLALERQLGLPTSRRVWFKDYGWTATGSFKLLGAVNWMATNLARVGSCPVAAHSSGNFASGIAFAGQCFSKRVIVVMPESAPRVKFELTRSFGAEIRTYDITRDHVTGDRERMTREIAEQEGGVQASPYDDPAVIAGNGVGGLEIVADLRRQGRTLSHFICPVSGGGLMAGHALAINEAFPEAAIIGVEPAEAADFCQSLDAGHRVRLEFPTSICDGLLSYDVGVHNWPILSRLVTRCVPVPDHQTRLAMRWLYERHGMKSEPSGAIGMAAALSAMNLSEGSGDVVIVISGRNADETAFRNWIATD